MSDEAAVAAAAAAAAAAEDADLELAFDATKKKKKRKPVTAAAADEEGGAAAAAADAAAGSAAPAGGAGGAAAAASAQSAGSSAAAAAAAGGEDPSFNYDEMLGRVYSLLQANNPELADRQRKKLKPPEVMRVGSTRSAWVNFRACCAMMKRAQEHVMSFFLAELGTTGSIDGSERFLIRGKYPPKYVENLLRKYITEYVKCVMCNSLETELHRDAESRLFFLNCKSCGSQRSVAPIKAGFHATARGERKKAREAQ